MLTITSSPAAGLIVATVAQCPPSTVMAFGAASPMRTRNAPPGPTLQSVVTPGVTDTVRPTPGITRAFARAVGDVASLQAYTPTIAAATSARDNAGFFGPGLPTCLLYTSD